MMFADAPRFIGSPVALDNTQQIQGHTKPPTSLHVGPGAYFVNHNENIRGGWIKKSFSKREPMSPPSGIRVDRNHHYTAGVLIGTGIAQGGLNQKPSPGPGHYGSPIVISPRGGGKVSTF